MNMFDVIDEQVKKELLDMNLSGLRSKTISKHPKSNECVKATNEILMDVGLCCRFQHACVSTIEE